MTQKRRSQPSGLDRLTNTLVEDLLATSDADLLAEAEADDDHGSARARRAFERASRAGAVRVALNKNPARGRRVTSDNIRALDPKTARGWLNEYLASNPETAGQLNKITRKGNELSDEDVYGMLESLQLRGALTQNIEQSRR